VCLIFFFFSRRFSMARRFEVCGDVIRGPPFTQPKFFALIFFFLGGGDVVLFVFSRCAS
jgi:hypothetical protein